MLGVRRFGRIVRRAFNRTLVVLGMILVSYLVASILYALFEHKSFFDAVWWASVTGTTTGYGDMYPVTFGGRVVAMAFMWTMQILNIFLSALIVLAAILDRDLFSDKEQEQLKAGLFLVLKHFGLIPKNATHLPSLTELTRLGYQAEKEEETL